MFLYFVVYLTNKLCMHFQVGILICFWIFCHECDWFKYIYIITIEFKINHLFNHQKVISFFVRVSTITCTYM